MERSVNRRVLSVALITGVVTQILLLGFGLHASLFFANLVGENNFAYWILNGLYFVIGLAAPLLFIRWAELRVRIVVFFCLIAVGVLIGLRNVLR